MDFSRAAATRPVSRRRFMYASAAVGTALAFTRFAPNAYGVIAADDPLAISATRLRDDS
jgi:hypothetical protein